MSESTQDLASLSNQLKDIKGVNTVNSRRILVIYKWRLTHYNLKDMAIFKIKPFQYVYYKGHTYVLCDTGMIHPNIDYFNHYPVMFRESVIPQIKTVKTEHQWKLIEREMFIINQAEDQFNKRLELMIGVIVLMLTMMTFLHQLN